jgi:hypothetical protein
MKKLWLPKCLSHLNEPYIKDTDETVIIGQLSSEDRNGYKGHTFLHTALIPTDRLEEALNKKGGIGWKVDAWGPGPVVEKNQVYKSNFWVEGPKGRDDELEPLVVSWEHHNKVVMMPNNGLLMCYGTVPKNPKKSRQNYLGKPTSS